MEIIEHIDRVSEIALKLMGQLKRGWKIMGRVLASVWIGFKRLFPIPVVPAANSGGARCQHGSS